MPSSIPLADKPLELFRRGDAPRLRHRQDINHARRRRRRALLPDIELRRCSRHPHLHLLFCHLPLRRPEQIKHPIIINSRVRHLDGTSSSSSSSIASEQEPAHAPQHLSDRERLPRPGAPVREDDDASAVVVVVGGGGGGGGGGAQEREDLVEDGVRGCVVGREDVVEGEDLLLLLLLFPGGGGGGAPDADGYLDCVVYLGRGAGAVRGTL